MASFLLVAAAQAYDALLRRTEPDLQFGDQRVDQRPLASPVDQAETADRVEIRQCEVVTHRELQHQAFGFAVFWNEGEAIGNRRARSANRGWLPIEQNLTLHPVQPEQRGQELALTLPL